MRTGTAGFALAVAIVAAACAQPAAPAASPSPAAALSPPTTCAPSPTAEPTNYQADAPVRNKIGAGGYVIEGFVLRASCAPVAQARIEFWHVNPDGSYDDDHRATVVTDDRGQYRLDTTRPVAYGGGRAHVHLRVSRPGKSFVGIHFPEGAPVDHVDLVFDD